jgi:hypothetical protein
LRRVIFAFATRTPSALVGFCLGAIDVLAFPAVGIIGNTGVGIIDARSIGCVLIGPAVGLFLGIADNFFLPNSFKKAWTRAPPIIPRTAAAPDLPTIDDFEHHSALEHLGLEFSGVKLPLGRLTDTEAGFDAVSFRRFIGR